MKVLAVFICAVTVVACNPVSNAEWEDFKNNFGKSYDTTDEEQSRRAIFEDNTKIVNDHNERFNNGIETYNLKINEYADMTNIEFVTQMNGLKTSTIQSRNVFVYDPEEPANATVDWRNKGAVTSVKNQEQCGSCWAFSTTGSLEGQHFLKTKQLVSLSEQNLVDCSKEYGNNGCGGGLMDNAFKYIKANKGIDTEESYPYTAKDGKCNFDASNVGATLTGYVDVHHGNETALMHAVHKIGPISIGIDAAGSKFQLYHSGVYYNKECSSTKLDHGVLAVGYGEDNGQDYWLVKNSWGQSWGEEGYIMMSRNKDNNCGVATQASYPLV